MKSAILGTGSYLPVKSVSNQELVDTGLDTSDEWIVSRTGIRSRRIVAPEQATSDLAVEASRRALKSAGIDAKELGYIVCATSTPDHQLPAVANLVQDKIGATCGAIDMNAGCSGFVQAFLVGHALHEQSGGRPVLVIGADAYSRIMNWSDRRTAVFFGDGAGALVIGRAEAEAGCLLSSKSGSDGSGGACITTRAGGSRSPMTPEALESGAGFLTMDGPAVWKFAVSTVPDLVREVVADAGLSLEDIRLIVPHQANQKMLGVIAEELGVTAETLFSNVDKNANTAAASVGIALDEAVAEGRVQRGEHLVIVGFGAGLAWSAACIRF